MRKIVVGAAVAALLSGSGPALGSHAGTSPTDPEAIGNHPALYGLCTAWHANANGRAHGNAGNAAPFAALTEAAGDESVSEFCDGVRPGNGHGNGGGSQAPNPNEHPRNNPQG
jgi:hypothetical protein